MSNSSFDHLMILTDVLFARQRIPLADNPDLHTCLYWMQEFHHNIRQGNPPLHICHCRMPCCSHMPNWQWYLRTWKSWPFSHYKFTATFLLPIKESTGETSLFVKLPRRLKLLICLVRFQMIPDFDLNYFLFIFSFLYMKLLVVMDLMHPQVYYSYDTYYVTFIGHALY